ncbi:MAG: hypothetical protein J7601_12420 [Chloroflexi bacterium]|nr:hypothetical protein [Chloroflexota bacterium]
MSAARPSAVVVSRRGRPGQDALAGDDPTLILCPATLTLQWQAELLDKLGIPSAVWSSAKKRWIDHRGRDICTRGPEDIANCPMQIAIASTGLIFHNSEERRRLLGRRYGMGSWTKRAARAGGAGLANAGRTTCWI